MEDQGEAAQPATALNFSHISKLSPPVFHGKDIEVVQLWLYRFEAIKIIEQWNDDAPLHMAAMYLRGEAMEWYVGVRSTCTTFADFKAGLNVRFGETEAALMARVQNCKQSKDTSVRRYVDSLRMLFAKTAYPSSGQCTLFVNGLNSRFQDRVKLSCPKTLTEAIEAATDFEDMDIGSEGITQLLVPLSFKDSNHG